MEADQTSLAKEVMLLFCVLPPRSFYVVYVLLYIYQFSTSLPPVDLRPTYICTIHLPPARLPQSSASCKSLLRPAPRRLCPAILYMYSTDTYMYHKEVCSMAPIIFLRIYDT